MTAPEKVLDNSSSPAMIAFTNRGGNCFRSFSLIILLPCFRIIAEQGTVIVFVFLAGILFGLLCSHERHLLTTLTPCTDQLTYRSAQPSAFEASMHMLGLHDLHCITSAWYR